MLIKRMPDYTLIISKEPTDIFKYYNVQEMHGLSLAECANYNNTETDSYIAGLCNYIPKQSPYELDDPCFVFINATRCRNNIESIRTIMHELMHMRNLHREEEIITWADEETDKVYNILLKYLNHESQKEIS